MSTPIADMVAVMLSAGIPPEIIALAVRTAEEHAHGLYAVDPVAAKRRAYDRERKRPKAEIPPENSDRSLSSSLPSNESKKEEKKERAKRDRGHLLPVEFVPKASHFLEAEGYGKPRDWVFAQLKAMRNWAAANEHRAVARKSNWGAAFSGWMERNKGSSNGPAVGTGGGKVSPIAAALEQHTRDIAGSFDECGEVRPPPPRLISNG